jgi:hypothetical protein
VFYDAWQDEKRGGVGGGGCRDWKGGTRFGIGRGEWSGLRPGIWVSESFCREAQPDPGFPSYQRLVSTCTKSQKSNFSATLSRILGKSLRSKLFFSADGVACAIRNAVSLGIFSSIKNLVNGL